jgi:5'-3' exonuclease
MKAILDGDIMAYRIAFRADAEGIEDIDLWVQDALDAWTPSKASDVVVAFSCPRSKNFRRRIWEPYKAHRDTGKHAPDCLKEVEQSIKDHCSSFIVGNQIEADDLLGIATSTPGRSCIAVTIDKDLRSVPGWHWNPDKELEPVLVSEEEADRNFHIQWLTGDTTDNIPGIWKMGPAKANKVIDSVSKSNWTLAVLATYEQSVDKNKEKYTYDYCVTMARCVRILRYGETSAKRITTKTIDKEIKLWVPNCWS